MWVQKPLEDKKMMSSSVILELAALTPPGSLLEMHNLGPNPDLMNQKL